MSWAGVQLRKINGPRFQLQRGRFTRRGGQTSPLTSTSAQHWVAVLDRALMGGTVLHWNTYHSTGCNNGERKRLVRLVIWGVHI